MHKLMAGAFVAKIRGRRSVKWGLRIGPERLQIGRHRLHVVELQPTRHAVHHRHVAHVVLERAQLLDQILDVLASEPWIVVGTGSRSAMAGAARRYAGG
jgi:hypothetical protein